MSNLPLSGHGSVGVVGAGRMGLPMVRHLEQAGHSVHAFDVDPAALEAAVAAGASPAGSARELAAAAAAVFVLVGYPDQAENVLSGPDGLLAGAQQHQASTIVMVSTVGVDHVRRLASMCESSGVDFLDAPVCRGEDAAISGDLLWLVGGDSAVLERCKPAMRAAGPDIFHVGEVGAGQVAKAINNFLLWAAMCVDHEAFELGEAYGLDVEALRAALATSTGSNWPLEHWDRMSRIPWALKDMTLTLEIADAARLSLPLAGLVRERAKVWQWNAGYE